MARSYSGYCPDAKYPMFMGYDDDDTTIECVIMTDENELMVIGETSSLSMLQGGNNQLTLCSHP